ncbi:putative NodB homology domain-containing protein [Candidatus Magnetomoraceae bacterium gMMP-1]
MTVAVFTIDVEGIQGICSLPEQLDLEKNGIKYGLNAILDIAEAYDIKMTFFVDVYEYKKPFGIGPVKRIVEIIFDRGHDVQLHTHPGPLYDYKRNKMFQFSEKEQIEILQIGARLIEEWVGYYPEAHRSGAYAADLKTISALKKVGITLDSSYYYSHPNCKLNESIPYNNFLYNIDDIIELPITAFRFQKRINFLGNYFPPLCYFKKIDIDACNLTELKAAITKSIKCNYSTVNIFMHSFSLININKSKPDFKKIDKLKRLITWINENKIPTKTVKELIKVDKSKYNLSSSNKFPVINIEIGVAEYILKQIYINIKKFMKKRKIDEG